MGFPAGGELQPRRSGERHRRAHARLRRRTASGPAGRNRLGQDLHHGKVIEAIGKPPDPGAQQDTGRAALSRIQELLPSNAVDTSSAITTTTSEPTFRRVTSTSKRSHRQRRARQAAPFRTKSLFRAPRLRDCRQRELHLWPGLAEAY